MYIQINKILSLGSKLQLVSQWKDMHWCLEQTTLEHWLYKQ